MVSPLPILTTSCGVELIGPLDVCVLLTAGLLALLVFARVFASGFDAAFFVLTGFFTAAFFLSAGWSTGTTTSPFDLRLRAAFFARLFLLL